MTRWNVGRVAAISAVAGAIYTTARTVMNVPGAPAEYYLGNLAGGAIGGALLFGVVALIRNAAVGRRSP